MTVAGISSSEFPRLHRSVRARWAPVYLEPVMGSAERFVIAIAAVGQEGWHVEAANALHRLQCLYGSENGALIAEAVNTVLTELNYELAEGANTVFHDWKAPISGAHLGPVRLGEGASLEEIARSWMRSMSSLYDRHGDRLELFEGEGAGVSEASNADRLPGLVYQYVQDVEPTLTRFFRRDLLDERRRRNYGVSIDFAGSVVAANFGTLRAGRPAASVDFIKKRLWDLKVDREAEGGIAPRLHEMLVQVPDRYDPQVTERQQEAIEQAKDALEAQADSLELRFETFVNVHDLGSRLVTIERSLLLK